MLALRLAIIAALAAPAWWVSVPSPDAPDVGALMARVGERVALYCTRAQSVICTERSTVQPIDRGWSADGMARTVESELRVEFEDDEGRPLAEPRVTRDVRRVNGRAPRERDRKDRSGCTDPNPLSPEPLAFLLPAHREEYRFSSVRNRTEDGRAVLVVDFESAARSSRPQLVEDERGHDDCFDWTGPLATKGQVWVDAGTADVLRVERRIPGPVDIRVPPPLQRRYLFEPWVVLDRDDVTMRYRAVKFTDPDDSLLLPESIDSMTVLRTGLQSVRRTQTFSDYRRFLTKARIFRR